MQAHINSENFVYTTPSVETINSGRYYDEEQIILGLRKQKSSVIDWVYKRYFPTIKNLILRRGGTSDEAADIFQEAIIAVYINILKDKYKDQNKFSAYLRQVSLNLWNGHIRKRNRLPVKTFCHPQEDLMDHIFAYAEKEHKANLEEEIRRGKLAELACDCLDKMKPDAQQLMRSYYFERKKLKDLASQFGWTEGYIKQKIRRCRQQLEKLIISCPAYQELIEY